jgi:hypothetical protein
MRLTRSFALLSSIGAFLLLSLVLPVHAAQLPAGLVQYVTQLDKGVKIRQDGLIILPSGSIYLPVMSQDPTVNPNPQKVVKQWLDKTNTPELVQFDNNWFLLRLSKGARGKLLTAKLAYPMN